MQSVILLPIKYILFVICVLPFKNNKERTTIKSAGLKYFGKDIVCIVSDF